MPIGGCGTLLILGMVFKNLGQLRRILVNQILCGDKDILIRILDSHITAYPVPENIRIFPAGQHKVYLLRRTVCRYFLPFNRNACLFCNFLCHFLVFCGNRAVRANHHRNFYRLHFARILNNRKSTVQIKIIQPPRLLRSPGLYSLIAAGLGSLSAPRRQTHTHT